MFVFYLLNLFRVLNSSGWGNRTPTGLSAHGILSPACLNELEIFISSNALNIYFYPMDYTFIVFIEKLMLHLVSTLARIISYAAWLGITCYPYFRTVGFLRKWIRWPVGFNMFLFKEQNTYLTFTDFEAISPLYWWANIFTSFTNPPYFNLFFQRTTIVQ